MLMSQPEPKRSEVQYRCADSKEAAALITLRYISHKTELFSFEGNYAPDDRLVFRIESEFIDVMIYALVDLKLRFSISREFGSIILTVFIKDKHYMSISPFINAVRTVDTQFVDLDARVYDAQAQLFTFHQVLEFARNNGYDMYVENCTGGMWHKDHSDTGFKIEIPKHDVNKILELIYIVSRTFDLYSIEDVNCDGVRQVRIIVQISNDEAEKLIVPFVYP